MKKLTQAIFDGAPDWVKSAGVVKDGKACWYPCAKRYMKTSIIGFHPPYDVMPRWQEVDEGFDATDWQNSAIDREVQS